MTLEEWTAKIREDLKAAGFESEVYHGFPLVRSGPDLKLIKFKASVSCDKRIYKEGMLFVPFGSPP